MSGAGGIHGAWLEANQRFIVARLSVLSGLLTPESGDVAAARRALDEAREAMPAPPALEVLAATFGLSDFECDVLLMCAGVELDSNFAARCASALGTPLRPQPSFSFALAVLPEAHWNALGPEAPLRRFQLLELGPGDSLTRSPLRLAECVLHFLVGVEHTDERLFGLLESAPRASKLVPSQQEVAGQLAAMWQPVPEGNGVPRVELWGGEPQSRRDVVAAACSVLGLRLKVLDAGALAARSDLDALGRLLVRELLLGRKALLVESSGTDDMAELVQRGALARLMSALPGPVAVSTPDRLRPGSRPMVPLEVKRPTAAEQRTLWREAVATDDALFEPLIAHFDLDASAISAACAAALASAGAGRSLGDALWESCRVGSRPGLDGLAERIESAATWDELVLPDASLQALRALASSLRQRARVHGAWGFAERGERGLGVGALFAGPSGTGKTLAAEVLAAELRLDLFRVDLSQLVSKYLGETEKNLRRVFDAAERGAAILLFDEADALFGRRGEARDAHDRYANLEVAYLLQRMEAYRGLAILTTNLESALDPAFLRRLRFVVRFPLPGAAERLALWRRAFPVRTPTEGLDFERLAQLGLTGGGIHNVALRAAYRAAEAGTPVRMEHVLDAARAEYEKLGRQAQGVQ